MHSISVLYFSFINFTALLTELISPYSLISSIDLKISSSELNKHFFKSYPFLQKEIIFFDSKITSFLFDWRSGTASKAQRKSFRARMMGIKRKDGTFAYKDKTSPAYWALNYLW